MRPRRLAIELDEPLDPHADAVRVDEDLRAQDALGLAPADREEPVRGDRLHGLVELVVLLELRRFVALAGHHRRDQLAVLGVLLTDPRTHLGGIGDLLGDDVARAGERLLRVRDTLDHERRGLGQRIAVRGLRCDPLRERREPLVTGDRGARLPPRAVRRVQILELALAGRAAQLGLELGR